MQHRTDLSSGALNRSDRLLIQLIEGDTPPIVAITWPTKPSMTTPDSYANMAASCMQVLSAAVIELAAIKTWRKL